MLILFIVIQFPVFPWIFIAFMFQITVAAANVVMVAAASGDAVRNLKPHTCYQILVNFVVIIVSFSLVIVFGL